jgi:hypothetical protein
MPVFFGEPENQLCPGGVFQQFSEKGTEYHIGEQFDKKVKNAGCEIGQNGTGEIRIGKSGEPGGQFR